jgi:hypothetical protein
VEPYDQVMRDQGEPETAHGDGEPRGSGLVLSWRVQLRATLPDRLLKILDPVRLRWDPRRARGNPAHATIVYHDEVQSAAEMTARVRAASVACAPFTLVLGRAERFTLPDRGAYLRVDDPGNAVAAFRARALGPPSSPRTRYGLHVTLLHPASGERLDDAWDELAAIASLGPFEVRELQMVNEHNAVLATFPLLGK